LTGPETNSSAPLALPEARERRRLNPPVEPPPSSFPRRRRRQGPSGEALVAPAAAACLSPRSGERVRALPLLGGGAPREASVRRGRVVMVVWRRRGGAPWSQWSSSASSLLDLGSLGSIWARVGLDGLGWARTLASAEPPGGGGALRARLGPAGPIWAWCAPAALSGRRLPRGGGGGGFLAHGWRYCPCCDVVICLYLLGHTLLSTKRR
jgi:hypothetical protein